MTDNEKEDEPGPETSSGRNSRTMVRNSVESLSGVLGEMARIYREMKAGKRDHAEGRSLVWVLSQLRAGVEAKAIEDLEAKLDKVAEAHGISGNGNQSAARQARRPH